MREGDDPIVVEQTFEATIEAVWKSITAIDQMRKWYFENIPSFKPEVGFETQFNVESGGRDFLHMWRVTDVVPGQRIVYDWKFDGYPGDSFVVFELSQQDNLTKLRLTVHVRESFPEDIPELTRESCIAGWEYFIRGRLKEYLEGLQLNVGGSVSFSTSGGCGGIEPASIPGCDRSAVREQSIILRPAKSILEEGVVYARYLDQAAEGFFRLMLGRRAADIVAVAYTQPDNDHSYQNVTFAERDNVIVGMASGFTARQRHGFSDQPLKRAAGKRHLRMSAVTTLCAPLFRILETLGDDEFYLLAVAVDKELRGAGVGSILIDHIEERAVAGGSARLSLDVSAKNKGARRLYEKRGMTVESEWPKSRFIPTLFVRMTKPL